eukprot:SAG22_NODE_2300_length_2739_cov_2.636364_3_plen_115_part_00
MPLPRSAKERDRVLREVKSLARLDHVNIVRYYQAWIEQVAAADLSRVLSGPGSPRGAGSSVGYSNYSNSAFSTTFTLDGSSAGSAFDGEQGSHGGGANADREVLFIQMKLCQDK